MADLMQQAQVEIFGKTYTLVSDQPEEYARRIAEDVDRRMTAIAAERNLADTTKIAMMAAMEIADELMRTREKGSAAVAAANNVGEKLKTFITEANG